VVGYIRAPGDAFQRALDMLLTEYVLYRFAEAGETCRPFYAARLFQYFGESVFGCRWGIQVGLERAPCGGVRNQFRCVRF